jgi:hypothetical protein
VRVVSRIHPWLLIAAVAVVATATGCAARASVPDSWAARFPDAEAIRIQELLPGVRHVYLRLRSGPWAVHVVEVEEDVCVPRIAAVKAGPPLDAVAPTSTLGREAVAAINGDFFMDPGGTPVGAHVQRGRVLASPGSRPIYGLDTAGRHGAGTGVLVGFAAVGGDTVVVSLVNRPRRAGRHHPVAPGLALFDEWYGGRLPAQAGTATIEVAAAREGRTGGVGRGVVVATGDGALATPLAPDRVAFRATGDRAIDWLHRRAPGDTVSWAVRVALADGPELAITEAVGGFPLLLRDGRGVYGEQPGVIASFGPVRHPRTAVAWDAPGRRLLWVVVDGRQAPYSDGMSLPELEALLLRLGATDALNLDGGGSTALAIRGALANRPSDAIGERLVANGLALDGCR